jgi:DNA invertase Pin-like site-specific DNA recombinase
MPYLSELSREALRRVKLGDESEILPEPLERLAGLRDLVSELEQDEAVRASVREALAAGSTWEQIATAAGLKSAAAKWRWQGSDDEIFERHESGRKRSARPSSIPTDLPGMSVADAAKKLGVSAQAVYLRLTRGTLHGETVDLPDGRSYRRVFVEDSDS